ncbi:MAG: DUF6067 family protein [bacterium]|nr:DUF6067 family protein [bacterium]
MINAEDKNETTGKKAKNFSTGELKNIKSLPEMKTDSKSIFSLSAFEIFTFIVLLIISANTMVNASKLPEKDFSENNLIKNSGFENGLGNWKPFCRRYYHGGKVSITQEDVYRGDKSLRIEGKKNDAHLSIYYLIAECKEKCKYDLSFFYKTSWEPHPALTIKIDFRNKQGQIIRRKFFHPRSPQKNYECFKCDFFSSQGAASFCVCIIAQGIGTTWIDEVRIIPGKISNNINLPSSAYTLGASADYAIWYENPISKVPFEISNLFLEKLKKKEEIKISAAKGEYEPFQLVISPLKNLGKVKIQFTDLKNKENRVILKKECLSYNPVGYVNITKVTNNLNVLGLNEDLLLPINETEVKKGQNQPFWITIKVPCNINSGEYNGYINIITEKDILSPIPLKLFIWDFEIPPQNPLPTRFYFNERWARRFDKRPLQEIMNNFFENLKDHRVGGCRSYYEENWPKFEIVQDNLRIIDFTDFDSFFEPIKKYNLNTCYPIPGIGRPWVWGFNCGLWEDNEGWLGYKLLTPEFNRYFEQYCQQVGKHLQEKKLLEKSIAYVYDEPLLGDFEKIRELGNIVKKGYSRIITFVTKTPEPGLQGPFDIFCGLFPAAFVPEVARAAKKKGHKLWGYNYPMSLEIPLLAHRIYTWQAYLAELDGLMLWNVNNWRNPTVSPWKNPTLRNNDKDTTPAGEAIALYPHPSGNGPVVNTIRWENVREAMEDYAYLWLLEREINGVKEKLSFPEFSAKQRIREIIFPLIQDIDKYSENSALLFKIREQCAQNILEMKKSPLLLLGSNLPENTPIAVNIIMLFGKTEQGTKITINGQSIPVSSNGYFEKELSLKEGKNEVKIIAEKDGKGKILYRKFLVKNDNSINLFSSKINTLKGKGIDVHEYESLLNKLKNHYGAREKELLEKAIKRITIKELEILIASEKLSALSNKSYTFLLKNAEKQAAKGNTRKVKSYLAQLGKIKKMNETSKLPCSLEIINYHNHMAYKLKNSILEIVVLENGGRIIEFNVKGVPTLYKNLENLNKNYSEDIRSNWDKLKKKDWIDIGGYEDWGEWKWILSQLDWEYEIIKLEPEEIILTAMISIPETLTPGAKFKLARTMTLEAHQPYLKMEYKISNPAPERDRLYQQDPYQYNFHWRAHAEFSIGKTSDNDFFVIPSQQTLRHQKFSLNVPELFSQFIVLNDNYFGAYDPKEKIGIFNVIPREIKNLLLYYNSLNSAGHYNLELIKSPLKGLVKCKPFNILPGENLSFNIYLIGVSGHNQADAEDFISKLSNKLQ